MGWGRLIAAAALGAFLAGLPVLLPVYTAKADDAGTQSTTQQGQTPPPAPNGCPFRNNKLELIA
jgi:hypothetical protein